MLILLIGIYNYKYKRKSGTKYTYTCLNRIHVVLTYPPTMSHKDENLIAYLTPSTQAIFLS